MKNYFSIKQTAETVGMTAETLRHYDRIGLVKPCKTDEWTGYRYYSRQEIVRLDTVKALRCMDLTLSEIKEILEYDDFGKIVATLKQAEKNADGKIAELNYAKSKIARARTFYESKLNGEYRQDGVFVKRYPQRVILLSNTMDTPTLDNLWDYHRRFYGQIADDKRSDFAFEDTAGIFTRGDRSSLFAICTRYASADGLEILPQGDYLCADCTEENSEAVIRKLHALAESEYKTKPEFTIRLVVLSGILQWNYQAQILIS